MFFVVSRKHGLIPFGGRLRNEGANVKLAVWKPRFEAAWAGDFEDILHEGNAPSRDALAKLQEQLSAPDTVLLSDVPHLELSAESNYLLGSQQASSPLRLGAWISQADEILAPHLMIYDLGVWPGGMGRLDIASGACQIRLTGAAAEFAREQLAQANLEDVRGLVELDIVPDGDGDISLGEANEGWNWLQSHCFLAGLENFGGVLMGEAPSFGGGSKFSTAIPVSIPPWPEFGRPAAEVEIAPMAPQLRSQVLWHDMALDLEAKEMRTAGLDGLVGVAYGNGAQPGAALQRALTVANAIQVAEKQWRPDIGRNVSAVLEAFELHYGLVL